MGRPLASDLDLGGVWGHPQSKLWLDRAKTLRMPLAPASPPASPLESKARLVCGSIWEGSQAGSSLWVKEAVPVSLTLAPGPAVEELLDEVLGLFFHYRGGGDVRR